MVLDVVRHRRWPGAVGPESPQGPPRRPARTRFFGSCDGLYNNL